MIVALQTADTTTRMWLLNPKGPDIGKPNLEWESGRQLADQLLEKLTKTLKTAKCDVGDITAFIIYSGPGSFTSLRIGHSVVNALADSLGMPVVGAMGEQWLQEGIAELAASPLPGRPALPHYGAEANITKPKN